MPDAAQRAAPCCESPHGDSSCAPQATSKAPSFARRALVLQCVTILWMTVECVVSLLSARSAHSLALAAFGGDSLVELLSAGLALYSLSNSGLSTRTIARLSGVLLYALAVVVAVTAIVKLVTRAPSESSLAGIAVTAAALVVMPVLARLKRDVARKLNNTALAADAVQSAMCAYLSAIALISLLVEGLFHIHWLDGVAALIALPVLVIEARRAIKGEACGCGCA